MYNYDEQYGSEFIDLTLEDSQYKYDNIIDNPLSLFLQEIELAIKIAPGEIWGVYENININKYVFNKYVTLNQVKTEIQNYISTNCIQANRFVWSVDAEFLNIDGNNLLYIIVSIDKGDSTIPIKVKFLLGNT